jgi:GNAT superfamily N-acetyltransferase
VRGATRGDVARLRAFRCVFGRGVWYEREAAKVIRVAARRLEQRTLAETDEVMLFEVGDDLVGVAVVVAESSDTAHIAVLAVERSLRGARLGSDAGPRLSATILSTALDDAQRRGYRRATAIVARQHRRSRRLLDQAGFAFESRFDDSYDLHAVAL